MMANASRLLLLLLILGTSLSFKCGGGAALSDPYRKASQAADDIVVAINTAAKTKRELGSNGLISATEELALTNQLQQMNSAHRAFISQVRSLRADPDPQTKASLIDSYGKLVVSANQLLAGGVATLRNQQAKDRFQQTLQTLPAAFSVLGAALDCVYVPPCTRCGDKLICP
jgi:type IV secretory pathway TrbF-like protein